MKNFILNLQSKDKVTNYINRTNLMKYEQVIIDELLLAIEQTDIEKSNYLNRFGNSFRAITMNLQAHRKGLEFGFTKIAFDQYSWLKRVIEILNKRINQKTSLFKSCNDWINSLLIWYD